MTEFRVGVIGAAVAVVLGVAASLSPASATQIYVSNVSVQPHEAATITGGLLGAGVSDTIAYTGQQQDTINPGTSYSTTGQMVIDAWCVDLQHTITLGTNTTSGPVYTVGALSSITSAPAVTLTTSQINQIEWLANLGNTQLANYTVADMFKWGTSTSFSAAVQVAIWNTEYGTTYTGSDSHVTTDIASFGSIYSSSPLLYPFTPGMTAVALLSYSNPQTQELLTFVPTGSFAPLGVPEPASAALLATGLFAAGFIRRRRQRAV